VRLLRQTRTGECGNGRGCYAGEPCADNTHYNPLMLHHHFFPSSDSRGVSILFNAMKEKTPMKIRTLILATTACALACVLAGIHQTRIRQSSANAAASPLPRPCPQPIAATNLSTPEGVRATIIQLTQLLEAEEYEDAIRLCWEPSKLDQIDRSKAFPRIVELVRQNGKLRPSLARALAMGPEKTFTNENGRQYIDFNKNTPEFESLTFVCVNEHWYMW
jgi:hypothetical protein